MQRLKVFLAIFIFIIIGVYFFIDKKIKVSVIVTVYNSEKYLEKCLDSLQKQTLEDMEFIVIDDGSKDKSFEIMKKYRKKDKRFKIYSKPNEGVGITRNMGQKIAKGEYIGFVDSDDYVSKNYFEELYKTAKKYDADVSVICDYFKFSENYFEKHYTFVRDFIKEEKYFIDDMSFLFGNLGQQWDKIYKKSFLDKYKIRSYEKRLWFEDVYFSSIVALYASRISFTNKTLYFYRYNPSGITQTSYMDRDIFEKGILLYDDLYQIVSKEEFHHNKKEVLFDSLKKKIEWYRNTYNKDNILYK